MRQREKPVSSGEQRQGKSRALFPSLASLDGLVHLARLVLEVAAKEFVGAHQHFDQAGELDTCDMPLTIVLKSAEWDV